MPSRSALEVELADAVYRILDLAEAEGLDIDGALVEKRSYNKSRLDHQLEARNAPGGKRF